MKVANLMFSKNLGGIEQAFIDYTKALVIEGNDVLCITQKNAKINAVVEKLLNNEKYKNNITHIKISNLGKWDIFAKLKIAKALKDFKAEIVIAHGNRPTQLARRAANSANAKLVSVAHNYKIKPLLKAEYIFSITKDLKNFISKKGFSEEKIFVVPNMLEFDESEFSYRTQKQFPTIGVMARFVKKKGVDVFLKALAGLKSKHVPFFAIIAGDGEERDNLQKMRDELKLNSQVRFIGWAKDKKKDFYDKIDIFCLPSHHEPFGIVLLEAMLAGKPIVTTASEGPLEIIDNKKDGNMVPTDHAGELALALEELIKDPLRGKLYAENAFEKLKERYHISKVARLINSNLNTML